MYLPHTYTIHAVYTETFKDTYNRITRQEVIKGNNTAFRPQPKRQKAVLGTTFLLFSTIQNVYYGSRRNGFHSQGVVFLGIERD